MGYIFMVKIKVKILKDHLFILKWLSIKNLRVRVSLNLRSVNEAAIRMHVNTKLS